MGKPKLFIARDIKPETADWLNQADIAYKAEPLIRIDYCKSEKLWFERKPEEQLLFLITSQWAAKWLMEYHQQIGFSSEDMLCCISEKQADILKPLTEKIQISSEKNALSLVAMVKEINPSGSIVYLRGNRSLNHFQKHLSGFGKRFVQIGVYRNNPVMIHLTESYNLYLFFSPSAIHSFCDAGNTISDGAMVVTIGSTTLKACETLLKRKALVSERQDELFAVQFSVKKIKKSIK